MRNCILIFVFIVAFFTNCKKDSNDNTQIIGSWNWVKQTNDSWPPVDKTPQSTRINETVTFNSNNTYTIVRNGNEAENGKFSTSLFTTYSGKTSTKIVFKRGFGADSVDYFKVSGTSLTFSNDYSGTNGDGIRFYEKQ